MRKIIWRGMLGAMCCAAVLYLATTYADHHPDSVFAHSWQMAYKAAFEHGPLHRLGKLARSENLGEVEVQEQICAPDEPHPADVLLPDPAKLTADWQPFETINVPENSN